MSADTLVNFRSLLVKRNIMTFTRRLVSGTAQLALSNAL